ncbi:hypothetical protein L484_020784 [Morus notabilis]|uniref:CRM domain-containing protein n=1 Tax=Morus notabilis TaxID=981085 RepID=W9S348_9ROSA|nr:hypothetical protein L484_020784 [Morus notabilis]
MLLAKRSRLNRFPLLLALTRRFLSSSNLYDLYSFKPPPSLSHHQTPNPNSVANPEANNQKTKKSQKPRYRPPSSLDRTGSKPASSNLPFDFQYSYTESSLTVRPIGLREPKYSPFGPGRLDREWTGVCAPAVNRKVQSVEELVEEKEDMKLEEKRRKIREKLQGEPLTAAERKILVEKSQKLKTKSQVNLELNLLDSWLKRPLLKKADPWHPLGQKVLIVVN